MSEKLYGLSDMARLHGISASNMANRIARGVADIPSPAFEHGTKSYPLWTRAQLEQVIEGISSRARLVLTKGERHRTL